MPKATVRPTIRPEHQPPDVVGVLCESLRARACGSVPHLNGTVAGARQKAVAVRTPSYTQHPRLMACTQLKRLAVSSP